MTKSLTKRLILPGAFLLFLSPSAQAQKTAWRQATDAELTALLPTRATVEKEHIETEMRTASGIVDSRGRYIAGVVLITAGYTADDKYSHFLIVQTPLRISNFELKPGAYVFGWVRAGNVLSVHFNEAASGALVGTADAHRIAGRSRVESLRIWPPADKAMIQIGRFGISYKVGER
ncbi:MAG TPA: hypothetical protein VND66_14760 [Acidobacteriaceae bacterium]|nr:hypothetical protein [Acidobacteriaceae bacterium]